MLLTVLSFDLVKLNDDKVGVLYEWGNTANYEEIRFATFTEDWLDDSTVVQLNFDEQTSGTAPSTANSPGGQPGVRPQRPGLPSYFLRIQDSRVRFLISDNSTLTSLYSDVIVNDDEWHHIAAVRDADAGTPPTSRTIPEPAGLLGLGTMGLTCLMRRRPSRHE